jgi:REP element-mobilizing transposase RayT
MRRLRHRTKSGWTYFVTAKAGQINSAFQVKEMAELVIAKCLQYRSKGNYRVHDYLLMPSHLHLIRRPADSISLEKRMPFIKRGGAHEIHKVRAVTMQTCQSGFYESRVTDSIDDKRKADSIHFNPVLANLVERPKLWPFRSASGSFEWAPIPEGLEPATLGSTPARPNGPTPNSKSASA